MGPIKPYPSNRSEDCYALGVTNLTRRHTARLLPWNNRSLPSQDKPMHRKHIHCQATLCGLQISGSRIHQVRQRRLQWLFRGYKPQLWIKISRSEVRFIIGHVIDFKIFIEIIKKSSFRCIPKFDDATLSPLYNWSSTDMSYISLKLCTNFLERFVFVTKKCKCRRISVLGVIRIMMLVFLKARIGQTPRGQRFELRRLY